MDRFIFYFTLLAVVCIIGIQCELSEGKESDEPKIIGGSQTTIEMHPYQALLEVVIYKFRLLCGGSIVSKYYIVTAGHCLQGIDKVFVTIGSNSISGGDEYKVTKFYIHPKYNPPSYDYDVGVLYIKEGMTLDGTKAKAINLVDVGYDPKEDVTMIVTGWGVTEKGDISSTLLEIQVPVVSRSRCNELLEDNITNRMFCAGDLKGGKDSCQGDSGGPAVAKEINKLAGITSFGDGCGLPDSPGVYTLVGNKEVRMFIKNITSL